MAIRGCARQTVVVNGGRGDVFEAAYFIVRPDVPEDSLRAPDILREANRIVSECCFEPGRRPRRLRLFVLGALSGGAAVGLAWLLCALL